jgi:hypothetical protein
MPPSSHVVVTVLLIGAKISRLLDLYIRSQNISNVTRFLEKNIVDTHGHLKIVMVVCWFRNEMTISDNVSNRYLKLKYGALRIKTTPTVPYFIKYSQKIIEHPLKWFKYITP